MWIWNNRRGIARNNQDTNNALESYHGYMKDWLFYKRKNAHGKQMDDFVHTLLSNVCIMYWYKAQKKAAGLSKNWKRDKYVCNVILRTRTMDHSKVTWLQGYAGPAVVPSQSKPGTVYLVNWRLDRNACQCFWSLQGNNCKH